MNLLTYGNGVQLQSWTVKEIKPIGYCRVYYIADGDVWYQDEHGKRTLHHHTLYFFPSVKPYEIHHDPQHPIDCLWFHIDLFPTIVFDLVEINVEENSSLRYLLESIKQQYIENAGLTPSYHTLITALTEYCYEHQWLQTASGQLHKILAYMDMYYNQAISIEEISHHFNYTPEHFIRMFQKETNFTPYQYLIHRRMREAGNLLLQDVSVKEVALLVGYQDAKVFSYRFRQIFGVAPSQYKKFYTPTA